MEKSNEKFFLAANSGKGFVSHFENNYDIADGWQVFLIKGGPGTGKSSFMKHFAYHADTIGKQTVLCPCSSDPASLDGVILPNDKILLLDATAPHTVEPKCPGVCENLLDLGQFWNSGILRRHAAEIRTVMAENKRLHQKAARYLSAAGRVAESRLTTATSCTDAIRTAAYAERLCHRLLPVKKTSAAREWHRFLQGFTPLGVTAFPESVTGYREKIILNDPYGGVSRVMMQTVRDCALRAGYEVITLHDPLLPDGIDHVLVPERSLAFLTERAPLRFETSERRIHARRFSDVVALHATRERLNFERRLTAELLSESATVLATAKRVHDRLERYYIEAMDFPALTAFAEAFTRKVLEAK